MQISFWKSPLGISLFVHLILISMAILLQYKPTKSFVKVDFEVYELPKLAPKTLNLQPPKEVAPKPPEPEVKKKVFGVTRKAITAAPEDTTSTATVKLGNTVAKEQDNLKLNPEDEGALPIPADDFLVSSMPQLISEFKIKYPESAKKAGIEGPVVMDLLIDDQGQVRQVTLIKGPGFGLNEAALEAIKNFIFRPAKIKEQSVAVKIRYTYRFVLENR
ncbi:MAG: energy transducer TonB [Bdellovibrionales bacterium]|nr:energy transducer TonB [Bdellovibrionales bacterium]